MIELDLTTVPFSCFGSYMAISQIGGKLYLRSVSGGVSGKNMFCLELPGYDCFSLTATNSCVTLKAAGGSVEIAFADPGRLVLRGSTALRLTCDVPFSYYNRFRFQNTEICQLNLTFMRLAAYALSGELTADQNWCEKQSLPGIVVQTSPEFVLVLEELRHEWSREILRTTPAEAAEAREKEFADYIRAVPCPPASPSAPWLLANYVNWASTVAPRGLLRRNTVFMSKNAMCSTWSWDHCFNAVALSTGHPELAWDQFMCLFDFQDESGVIPDYVNDTGIAEGNCKPPVHGWALERMRRNMQLTPRQLQEAYTALCRWTNWWFTCRDYDGDGVCQYFHGNDSGWDNSTAFRESPDVELPDLQAFWPSRRGYWPVWPTNWASPTRPAAGAGSRRRCSPPWFSIVLSAAGPWRAAVTTTISSKTTACCCICRCWSPTGCRPSCAAR